MKGERARVTAAQPGMRTWRWPAALAAIGAVALALRLVYLQELRQSALFSVLIGDSLQFDMLARRIIAGDWSGDDVFYQAQLYPYLLAAAYKVGGFDTFFMRTIQACLGSVSCVLLAVAGRRFFDAPTGLAAGGLLAAYPPAIFFDGLIHKSGPDLFLMAVLVATTAACLDAPRWRWLVLMGVAVGALSWNRENARILFPVMAVWLLVWHRHAPLRRRVQMVLFFTLGTAAVLAPVAIRNARTSGEFLMTTSQFGPNFYIGNHAGASGGYEPLVPGRGNALFEREDAIRIAETAAARRLTASEVSDYWRDRAVADIRRAPLAWLRLMTKKTWLTFAAGEPLDTESIDAFASSSRLLETLRWFTFGVVMALAVFGAWAHRQHWRRLAILYAMFGFMAMSVVVFFVFARYRYPLVPIAMLFAAAGIVSLRRLHDQPVREWLPAALASVAVLVALHVPVTTSADETFVNYGAELVRRGRPEDAIPLLREAVRRDPGHARAHLDLALALQQTNQDPLAEFDAALRLDPNAAAAHAGRAIALHQNGRTREALASYAEAARLQPESVEILSNYGVALFEADEPQRASAVFERAVALQPDNVPLRLNLCRGMAESREATETIGCYRQAVAAAKSPKDVLDSQYALAQALSAAGRYSEALASLHRARAAARSIGDAAAVASIENALRLVDAASRR